MCPRVKSKIQFDFIKKFNWVRWSGCLMLNQKFLYLENKIETIKESIAQR